MSRKNDLLIDHDIDSIKVRDIVAYTLVTIV